LVNYHTNKFGDVFEESRPAYSHAAVLLEDCEEGCQHLSNQ